MWKAIILGCSLASSLGPDMHLCKILPAERLFLTEDECIERVNKIRTEIQSRPDTFVVCIPADDNQ